MMRILLLSTLIIAIGMAFFLIKVLSSKNGTFSSQHIHDSKAMRERGIHCVMGSRQGDASQEQVCGRRVDISNLDISNLGISKTRK